MLQMMYMAEVMQIIGAVLLIAIGVGVIMYTLMRKSPTAAKEEEMRAIEDAENEDAENEDAENQDTENQDTENQDTDDSESGAVPSEDEPETVAAGDAEQSEK